MLACARWQMNPVRCGEAHRAFVSIYMALPPLPTDQIHIFGEKYAYRARKRKKEREIWWRYAVAHRPCIFRTTANGRASTRSLAARFFALGDISLERISLFRPHESRRAQTLLTRVGRRMNLDAVRPRRSFRQTSTST